MNDGIKQLVLNLGGRLLDHGVNRLSVQGAVPDFVEIAVASSLAAEARFEAAAAHLNAI